MATKTTAGEMAEFFADEVFWHPGASDDYTWFDDASICVGGELVDDSLFDEMEPHLRVVIEGGFVYGRVVGQTEPSLEAYLKRWRKQKDTETILVQVPKNKAQELNSFLKSIGAKVKA